MCIRAVGHGWSVCLIQFVKGGWRCGEIQGLKRLAPGVELHIVGEGFVGILDDSRDFEQHLQAAGKGVVLALDKLYSGKHQLVILDELNVAHSLGLVSREEIEEILAAKGERQHLVITGRGATDWLLKKADLVTEMKEIKHPFQDGIPAQKGIDW